MPASMSITTTVKLAKNDLKKLFSGYLQGFDWVANPKGKITASAKRMLMAKYVNQVAAEFDTKHPTMVKNSGEQCGMAMTIDGSDQDKIQPPLYTAFSLRAF